VRPQLLARWSRRANTGRVMSDSATRQAHEKFQRIARYAACAGVATSVLLAALRFLPGTASLHSSVEVACILFWPSAILLLGAQSLEGGVVLFIVSAILNAGYFVFATMLVAAVFEKKRARIQAPAKVAVARRSANARLNERLGSSRTAA
jgi:hypothetical protein